MQTLETALEDRRLRFDGISIVQPEDVPAFLAGGVKITELRASFENDDVRLFNSMVSDCEKLLIDSSEPVRINAKWNLPKDIDELDLDQFIIDAFTERVESLLYDIDQKTAAYNRVADELLEIRRRGMVEFTKTIVYIIRTFKEQGVVWGVGRGSSCASYILFILGLHVVDCIKYEIPMGEFFHD